MSKTIKWENTARRKKNKQQKKHLIWKIASPQKNMTHTSMIVV